MIKYKYPNTKEADNETTSEEENFTKPISANNIK